MTGSNSRLTLGRGLSDMDSLKQYTDLFRDNRSLLESNSPEVMNRLRERALKTLEERGLPPKGSENYETKDLAAVLAPDFGLNLGRYRIDANPAVSFHCGVPNLSTLLAFQVNDLVSVPVSTKENMPEGVFIGSMREFAEKYPGEAEAHYGQLADLENPVVALDTLLAQDAVVIRVDEGIRMEKPVQIVNILNSVNPLMAVRRVLVIAEADSEVRILSCDHTQNPSQEFLSLQTIEIFAGKNSTVDFYDLEESSEKTSRLSALFLSQEAGSNVMADGITLCNGTTRNEYFCRFAGPHAALKLYGMGIEDRERHLDTYSKVVHAECDCKTDELFKYVVDGRATGAFAGLVLVEKGADRTEAYQSNRNIVDSAEARMFSKPQLEIYDDDVKCSHGTATGQLDDMQVFYMRTRGLSEQTARLLLKQAFMADVIDGVRLNSLRDRLHLLTERRFAGESSSCTSCRAACGDNNRSC